MNLTSTRYAFTSAYLKGEEARSLMAEHIDGILQRSKNAQDVLEIIRDTDIGEYLSESALSESETFVDIDESLWRYIGECTRRLTYFNLPSDMTEMLDVYMKKYDISNIKTALRCVVTEQHAPMIPLGKIYSQGYLEEMENAKSPDEIADILVKANVSHYISIVTAIKEKDMRSTFEGEFKLDSLYYQTVMKALGKMSDGSVLTKALGIIIDLSNLRIALRNAVGKKTALTGEFIVAEGSMLTVEEVRELLSLSINEIAVRLENTEYAHMAQEISKTYEKEKAITVIDKTLEKYKVRLLRDLLSPRALSPCNLLWYLILKELEIRNLRLIFKTLEDGIPPAEIRDYVVTAS